MDPTMAARASERSELLNSQAKLIKPKAAVRLYMQGYELIFQSRTPPPETLSSQRLEDYPPHAVPGVGGFIL